MPVWHERTKSAVAEGRLALLGVIQEQHAERCRLFAQWKGFEWPILQDAINVLEPRGVPIVVAIDESGIVGAINPEPDAFATFMENDNGASHNSETTRTASRQHLYEQATKRASSQPRDAVTNRQIGDSLMLWGSQQDLDTAVGAYEKATVLEPGDGAAHFRLGVALRRRYESDFRQPNDFQLAITSWNRALEIDPNQYIWRRRIQQYGPRMTKPYAFYDWVAQAQTDIRARGDQPVPLQVDLSRAELALPSKEADFLGKKSAEPDPDNKITNDSDPLVHVVATVVPPSAKPGATVRVFLELKPDAVRQVHWTNDAGPTIVWIGTENANAPQLEQSLWELKSSDGQAAAANFATSDETRVIEFEAQLPNSVSDSSELSGYALYYVCEGPSGTCVYRRQNLSVTIPASSSQ